MREQETVRLKKSFEKIQGSLAKTQALFDKLSESGKAPEEVMRKLRESIDQQQRELESTQNQVQALETI
jgi:cell division protein FtsB